MIGRNSGQTKKSNMRHVPRAWAVRLGSELRKPKSALCSGRQTQGFHNLNIDKIGLTVVQIEFHGPKPKLSQFGLESNPARPHTGAVRPNHFKSLSHSLSPSGVSKNFPRILTSIDTCKQKRGRRSEAMIGAGKIKQYANVLDKPLSRGRQEVFLLLSLSKHHFLFESSKISMGAGQNISIRVTHQSPFSSFLG